MGNHSHSGGHSSGRSSSSHCSNPGCNCKCRDCCACGSRSRCCKKRRPPTPQSCICPPGPPGPSGPRGFQGPSGPPGSCICPPGENGHILKFSGVVGLEAALVPAATLFSGLADSGPIVGAGGMVVTPLVLNPIGLLPSYPIAEPVAFSTLRVRVGFNSVLAILDPLPLPLPAPIPLPANAEVVVELFRNGASTGLLVTFPALTLSNVQGFDTGLVTYVPGDTLDLVVSLRNTSTLLPIALGLIINVSATLQ